MLKQPSFFHEGDQGGASGGAAPAAGSTLLSGAPSGAPADPAAPSGAAASSPWIKEDGTFEANWLERLDPDLRGNPSLSILGSVKDLAKSYVETKSLIGKKLEAPGENATPEQIANWRKVIGAPDDVKGYLGDAKSLRPESVPEGLWDTASEAKFLELAHKHHLPPAAVKDILGFYGGSIAEGLQKTQEAEAQVLATEGTKLREAWGKEYDTNLALAARVAHTVGLNPNENPAFTNSDIVQAFAKMGKLFSEDKLVQGQAGSINGSIAERIRDITDPKSVSQLARDYRGEGGSERQAAAQAQYHELLRAQQAK